MCVQSVCAACVKGYERVKIASNAESQRGVRVLCGLLHFYLVGVCSVLPPCRSVHVCACVRE